MTARSFATFSKPDAGGGSMVRGRLRRSAFLSRSGWPVMGALAALVAGLCTGVPTVAARPLDEGIPGLFGGTLITTPQQGASNPSLKESQQLRFAAQFDSLSAELSTAHSQSPIPSASGAFRFAWDPELDTFVRATEGLGSGVAERASTLGRHTGTLNFAYTHIDFNTLEGNSLHDLTFYQPAYSPRLQPLLGNNVIKSQLNMGLSFDTFFFMGAFGITDSIDVSLALSMSEARMHATVVSQIQTPSGQPGTNFFLEQNNRLVSTSGQICGYDPQNPSKPLDVRCATDSFDGSAFGTGDLFLRGKWHFYDTPYADFAVSGILTIPTGNADNFLGFTDPTFTPWLIASKDFGPVSPHINLGYAFRSAADVSQAEWIAGADVRATRWLTLSADFLGYHDDKRDGINDDVLQSAVGFKVNPFDKVVIGNTFQFPLNRDGIRADVIYSAQIEYTY
jgi:hypothetical protein